MRGLRIGYGIMVLGSVAVVMAATRVQASIVTVEAVVDFTRFTSNSPDDIARYIHMDVWSDDDYKSLMLFDVRLDWDAPEGSFLSDIYFDDGALLGLSSLADVDDGDFSSSDDPFFGFIRDLGVDYVPIGGSETPMLPGGNTLSPRFVTTAGFGAEENNNPGRLGPGEHLGIIFELQWDKTVSDVLSYLDDGGLRIGIHAQGLPDSDEDPKVDLRK